MVEETNKQKQTAGAASLELAAKEPETRDPIELEREIHKGYVNEIMSCWNNSKKLFFDDFFIVVETKKERLLPNVIRNYIFSRSSCPTPNYDQTLYRYDKKKDELSFLWVIPSKDTCETFNQNILLIDPHERELLKFVLDFNDGTLLKLAKRFNKECATSNIIEN